MDIKNKYKSYVLNTYTRMGPVFVKGKGSFLFDESGSKYLDLFPGWGVGILGHSHPKIAGVISLQAKKLIHIPNNLYNVYQAELAEKIIRASFKGKVFFANSGTEGIEAAIKLAKAFGRGKKHKIIAMKNSFHGRTLGALSATGQAKYQQGFKPLVPGFVYAKFGDFDDFLRKVDNKTAAVIIEPIQGEGGVNIAPKEYLAELRKYCSQKGILLIFDEVQTGMARTGKMFAFQRFGVEPDVFVLAKGLGAGFPISALVVSSKYADVFSPGMHASTFGGSPLACRTGCEVFEVIETEGILENVKNIEKVLKYYLSEFKSKFSFVLKARGVGAMWALELSRECADVVKKALDRKLIINCTQKKVLRIMPALNIKTKILDKGLNILGKVLSEI